MGLRFRVLGLRSSFCRHQFCGVGSKLDETSFLGNTLSRIPPMDQDYCAEAKLLSALILFLKCLVSILLLRNVGVNIIYSR